LSGISADVQLLVSQTRTLAHLEVSGAVSTLLRSGVGLLAGALIAVFGAAVLTSALVLSLVALGVPAWLAAMLVGIVLTVGGALAAYHFATRMRRAQLGLKETREIVRETLEWLKSRMSSGAVRAEPG
jgi:hypothetical protein